MGLKLKAEARQQDIRRELPPVIDVLLMVLNSGSQHRPVPALCHDTAEERGSTGKPGAVGATSADVDNGMSYEAAFERMGQRLGIDEGYDLASLIRQALLQGGDITAALERFSAEIADKRVSQAARTYRPQDHSPHHCHAGLLHAGSDDRAGRARRNQHHRHSAQR